MNNWFEKSFCSFLKSSFYQPLLFRKTKTIHRIFEGWWQWVDRHIIEVCFGDTREDGGVPTGPSAPFYNSLSYLGKLRLFTESSNNDNCVHLGMFREVFFPSMLFRRCFSGDAFSAMLFHQPLIFRKTKTIYRIFEWWWQWVDRHIIEVCFGWYKRG